MVAKTQIKKFDEKTTVQKIIDGIHAEGQAAQQVMEQLFICVKAGKAGLVAIGHAAAALAEKYRGEDGKVIASNDDCKRLRANLRYMCERNDIKPVRTIKCNDTTANTWSVEDATPQASPDLTKATKKALEEVDKKALTFARGIMDFVSTKGGAKGKTKATLLLEAIAEAALLLEIDPDDLVVALTAKIEAQQEAENEEQEAA